MQVSNINSRHLQTILQTIGVALQPLFALGIRLYLLRVFLLAGLTKLRDWDSTLYLFTDEYHVPLLSPALAAVMGTGGELIFPILLILGWQGRFAAAGLFVVNFMAVISYPGLEPVMTKDHILWAILIAYLFIHGLGSWSIDAWLARPKSPASQPRPT